MGLKQSTPPMRKSDNRSESSDGSTSPPVRQGQTRANDKRQPTSGHNARDCAASALYSVFVEKRAFDDAFNQAASTRDLPGRDRAFARLIATTVLRQRTTLNTVIGRFLQKPLPTDRGRLEPILLCATAQLLCLQTPPHAAISIAVDQCRDDSAARNFANLANAVLRKVSTQGPAIFDSLDRVAPNIPGWLLARWQKNYGPDAAHAIAAASLSEPHLDLTVTHDIDTWAEALGARQILKHTLRLTDAGRIEDLAGYDAGAWWVQDAAASLPAALFGEISGKRVADLCAAPGGKTAQLASRGALVTAIDKSPGRLKRLTENLARLQLNAQTRVADAATLLDPDGFDAILIDAPCTATGTIRRHPDILHLKRAEDTAALAELQRTILAQAAKNLNPGGTLVYCTCSLEPEEGEHQIERFLAENPSYHRNPITCADLPILPSTSAEQTCGEWLTATGDLRTRPDLLTGGGMDGFFAARLVRAGQ